MNLARKAGLAAVLFLLLLWTGCGDVFRPVAQPILTPGGDPTGLRYAVVVNNNNGQTSTTTHVNLSGDTNIGNHPVGKGAVYAAFDRNLLTVYTADRDSDTVSFYAANAPAGTPGKTILLPVGSRPVFLLAGARGASLFVVNAGTNSVGVISLSRMALDATIPVGPNPVALAQTADGSKLYCVNQGNNTVTVISTVDNSVLNPGLAVGSSPVWAQMKADGTMLYVVNQGSSTVSVISTAADTVIGTLATGSGPRRTFYDPVKNRLYVANTSANSVSVFDASSSFGLPVLLGVVPVGGAPVAVTVLNDGLRAYVANSGSNTVSVINTLDLTIKTTTPVGENPVWIASSPTDNSRVFVANQGPPSAATCSGAVTADPAHPECYGFISNINTATDTVVAPVATNIPAGTTLPAGSPRPLFITVSF
jgi:YVTN family beta-propeller protein